MSSKWECGVRRKYCLNVEELFHYYKHSGALGADSTPTVSAAAFGWGLKIPGKPHASCKMGKCISE